VSLERPLDIALYASYEELRAVCQTWGLFGVQELALRSRSVLAEAFSTLDSIMRMHMPLLQRLKAEYLVCCTQSVSASLLVSVNSSQDLEAK
jgi:hypothetical protein